MRLLSDSSVGRPSLELSEDQLATVIDLICSGTAQARQLLTTGMLEVPMTILVKKAMRQIKRELGLTNLEITGEHELLDIENDDPKTRGRIDIILKFLHQFGDEEAYLAVECKRVAFGDTSLNQRYVTEGVNRFVTGRYATGHHWGVMLGYVLKLPAADIISKIDGRIREACGENAKLSETTFTHAQSISMHSGVLPQGSTGHVINLLHIFVDMTPAAASA
jgi:hypothetical protein